MSYTETFWNGEPCNAVRGTGVVADAPEFPQYWARTEGIVGQRIAVVRVFYGDWTYTLDNRDGQAWEKVTTGKGSPRYGHADVTLEPYSLEPESWVPFIREQIKQDAEKYVKAVEG